MYEAGCLAAEPDAATASYCQVKPRQYAEGIHEALGPCDARSREHSRSAAVLRSCCRSSAPREVREPGTFNAQARMRARLLVPLRCGPWLVQQVADRHPRDANGPARRLARAVRTVMVSSWCSAPPRNPRGFAAGRRSPAISPGWRLVGARNGKAESSARQKFEDQGHATSREISFKKHYPRLQFDRQ